MNDHSSTTFSVADWLLKNFKWTERSLTDNQSREDMIKSR